MYRQTFQDRSEIPVTLEESMRVLANTAFLVRQLIAQATGRQVEEIPIEITLFCARECCSDVDDYRQKPLPEIENNARTIADATAMAQRFIAEALSCDSTEVPIKQAINCALEALWDYDQKKTDKASREQTSRVLESLRDDW